MFIMKTYCVIAAACLLATIGVESSSIISPRRNEKDWDVYIFTQNWPASVCLSWEEEGKSHTCYAAADKTSWTVHGIWPTKFGTIGPSYCDESLPFNPEEIYGIKEELEVAWPSVEKQKKPMSFWKHEWEKHGTCASTIPKYPSELEYFSQGLHWSKQYNITTVLDNAGIKPGRYHDVSTIWSAVKEGFGKNPHIVCFTEKKSKTPYILEIRICFGKSFELVDCDGIKLEESWEQESGSGNFTKCSPNQMVEYPNGLGWPTVQ